MAKCKGCGQEIKWIKLESGKSNPVDIEKYHIQDNLIDPNMVVVNKEKGIVGKISNVESGYISHFSTCPNAKDFKKKKGE